MACCSTLLIAAALTRRASLSPRIRRHARRHATTPRLAGRQARRPNYGAASPRSQISLVVNSNFLPRPCRGVAHLFVMRTLRRSMIAGSAQPVKASRSRCGEVRFRIVRKFLVRSVRAAASRSLAPGLCGGASPIWDQFRELNPSRSFATFQAVFWPVGMRPQCSASLMALARRQSARGDARQGRAARPSIASPPSAQKCRRPRRPARRRFRPPDGRRARADARASAAIAR